MKKYLIIGSLLVAVLITIACKVDESERVTYVETVVIKQARNHLYRFFTVQYDGHEYVIWHDRIILECGGIVHSPDCPCLTRE